MAQYSMDQVLNDVFGYNSKLKHCPVISSWEGFCKIAAEECFSKGNDLDAVFHLAETHAIYLRHKAETSANYLMRRNNTNDPANGKDSVKIDFVDNISPERRRSLNGINTQFSASRGQGIIERLKDLPQEWTIVQVTSAFDVQFVVNPEKHRYSCPPSLYVTRMECGPKPAIITSQVHLVPNPSIPHGQQIFQNSSHVTKSFMEELENIIADELQVLKNGKKMNPKEYWTKRDAHSTRMKVLMSSIENQWLRGRKCLFLGKFIDAEDEKKIEAMVDKVLTSCESVDVSDRSRGILSLLLGAMPNLQPAEVHKMLRDALPDAQREQISEMMDAIEGMRESSLKTKPCQWKRHPVILILDKRIEGVPWEAMPALDGHSYSRVPSIHFAHGLCVERKKIKEAYIDASQGYYVVNPDGTLPKTEERMVQYLECRPEIWKGKKGVEMSPEEFVKVIKEHDLLLYSGHGSGSKYMKDIQHQPDSLRAVMLLMGCSSAKTERLCPHLDPWGAVYLHLLGRSPCVVGMLWSVTDLECDKITMKLLDLWLGPAKGVGEDKNDPKAKAEDDKTKGGIKFTTRISKSKRNVVSVPSLSAPEVLSLAHGDLLRSWAMSKHAASQFMTSASMVAYGIPVRATRGEDMVSLLNKLSKMSLNKN
ncbi:separin [Hetaerina americana]|uniref:separin n=1 Tax=Hetaerina americana TaxID=62018 RepID=UPI003A7F3CD6